jgi:hypothetical protein
MLPTMPGEHHDNAMNTFARPKHGIRSAMMTLAMIASLPFAAATPRAQQPAVAPKAQPTNGVVIRGCLTGSKLTHIDPADATLTVPDVLRVKSISVIRSQVTALDGHQVELIGTLRGIPGQENGVLVADSDKGRLYLGGGDTRLGDDLAVGRAEPPTMYARTIKDIAPACTAGQSR